MSLAPATNDAQPTKVLVVDDMPQNLLAMQALLECEGIQALCADSGEQALELLLVHEVALALLDVQMPGMDGFTLAELMRGAQRTRDIPIVFVTALPADAQRAITGYDTGAVDFLHKPVEPKVLLGKVSVFVQLHRQRQALQQHNAQLEAAITLNETMLAALGHDLRTPLSVVQASAAALERQALAAPAREAVARIGRSGARMAAMIEQLLDFARVRSRSLELTRATADLGEVAAQAATELRQLHASTPIELQVRGDTVGYFDAGRLGRAVSNLLANALEHGRPGAPVLLEVDGRAADRLAFSVRNAGAIDPGLLPQLFEPFKGSRRASGGLGLGLHIVAQFVAAHGGQVHVTSEAGQVCFDGWVPRSP